MILLAALALQLAVARPGDAVCSGDRCIVDHWPRSPLVVFFADDRKGLGRRDKTLLRTFANQFADFPHLQPSICVPANDRLSASRTAILRRTLAQAGYRNVVVAIEGAGCGINGRSRRTAGRLAYELALGPPPGW